MFEVEALNNTREADAVADVLGDAFTHDPAYRYILAGATDHVSKSNDGFVFKPMVFDALRQGIVEVIHVDGLIGGVALWYSPHRAALFGLLAGTAWLRSAWRLGIGGIRRLAESMSVTEKMKHRASIGAESWYLAMLGVRQTFQGRGMGKALASRWQARGSTYLETGNERNIAFYTGCGYRLVAESRVRQHGPTFWGFFVEFSTETQSAHCAEFESRQAISLTAPPPLASREFRRLIPGTPTPGAFRRPGGESG